MCSQVLCLPFVLQRLQSLSHCCKEDAHAHRLCAPGVILWGCADMHRSRRFGRLGHQEESSGRSSGGGASWGLVGPESLLPLPCRTLSPAWASANPYTTGSWSQLPAAVALELSPSLARSRPLNPVPYSLLPLPCRTLSQARAPSSPSLPRRCSVWNRPSARCQSPRSSGSTSSWTVGCCRCILV